MYTVQIKDVEIPQRDVNRPKYKPRRRDLSLLAKNKGKEIPRMEEGRPPRGNEKIHN